MHVLITGGGGFIGRKLAQRLVRDGVLRGRPIASVTLVDLAVPAPVPAPLPVSCLACDISDRTALGAIMARPFDVIFHLAAVVSGAA
ncbi:MAG: NAD-dependent epimerase/dehydratase family protein, partial [Rhodobacter sp.]